MLVTGVLSPSLEPGAHSAVMPMGLELCVLGWVILAGNDGAAAAWRLELGSWQVLWSLFAKG